MARRTIDDVILNMNGTPRRLANPSAESIVAKRGGKSFWLPWPCYANLSQLLGAVNPSIWLDLDGVDGSIAHWSNHLPKLIDFETKIRNLFAQVGQILSQVFVDGPAQFQKRIQDAGSNEADDNKSNQENQADRIHKSLTFLFESGDGISASVNLLGKNLAQQYFFAFCLSFASVHKLSYACVTVHFMFYVGEGQGMANLIAGQFGALAVASVFYCYREYKSIVDRKRRRLCDRVAYMLWVMANNVTE
jgi:hypothetical protein